jgi:hypothetical protein
MRRLYVEFVQREGTKLDGLVRCKLMECCCDVGCCPTDQSNANRRAEIATGAEVAKWQTLRSEIKSRLQQK